MPHGAGALAELSTPTGPKAKRRWLDSCSLGLIQDRDFGSAVDWLADSVIFTTWAGYVKTFGYRFKRPTENLIH